MTTQLTNVDAQLSILYTQIRPWVRTTLKNTEAQVRVEMIKFKRELHILIDIFEGWVSEQFSEVQALNLSRI